MKLRSLPTNSLPKQTSITPLTLAQVVIFLFATGCGGGDLPMHTPSDGAVPNGGTTVSNLPPHTLSDVAYIREVSACEAMPGQNCAAAFGFSIDSQGNFTAGPSPAGKIVQGVITAAELSALQAAVAPLLQSSSMRCMAYSLVPGIGDHLSASFTDGTQSDLYTQGLQVCIRGDIGAGRAFRDLFHQLLAQYYPIPFPGE